MYALLKLHILPSQWVDLSLEDKAFMIACIDLKIKAEKEQDKKLKSHSHR